MENRINCNINKLIIDSITNSHCNSPNNTNYIYFLNAALLFARIYGSYYVGSSKFNYSSDTMVLGESYTLTLPVNATNITVTIDTSAYFAWTSCFNQQYSTLQSPVCLYAVGLLFKVICDQEQCNDSRLKSLVSQFLLKHPINEKVDNKRCCNEGQNNCSICLNECTNFNNTCNNSLNNSYTNINDAYSCQIKDYISIMKDYLPCSL